MKNDQLRKELTLFDGIMLVIGSMIGSGIFIVASDIVRNVGTAGGLTIVWIITGIMTILAAISYGELSAMYPKAGGQYIYLKEAFHPIVGFLYGWSFFSVVQAGSIAAVGVAFSKFTAYIIPQVSEEIIWFQIGKIGISPAQLLAIVTIVILTWLNSRGVKNGKYIQDIFTSTKVLSLVILILGGLFCFNAKVWNANWINGWEIKPLDLTSNYSVSQMFGALAAAMVGAIFSSDAWNSVTFIAGEIKNPKRNVGLSLLLGTSAVIIIYILTNLMFTGVLSLDQIAHAEKDRVGVAVADVIFGSWGTIIIALMIMISTLGCNNGLIFSGARVYYSMAEDGLFFKKAAELNKFHVPGFGLWIQCVVASILCLSGKYGDLLDMISLVVVLFYVLTILGIFILRVKKPDQERPYKAWGYPILPAIYILMGIAFCVMLTIYKPEFTWPGLIIVAIGIPIYFVMKRKESN